MTQANRFDLQFLRHPTLVHHLIRYDHKPTCSYSSDPNVLDIALHVRLGDRVTYFHDNGVSHLGYLETFMETVEKTAIVYGRQTMFHVFSETSLPCPDENGFFPEFPDWQVSMDQVKGKRPPYLTREAAAVYICEKEQLGCTPIRPLCLLN